jgi:hypothetical protein
LSSPLIFPVLYTFHTWSVSIHLSSESIIKNTCRRMYPLDTGSPLPA